MSLLGIILEKQKNARATEEALYEFVSRELEQGIIRNGLWTKALAQSNMNESVAKSKYINLRVKSLRDELLNTERRTQAANERSVVSPTPNKTIGNTTEEGERKETIFDKVFNMTVMAFALSIPWIYFVAGIFYVLDIPRHEHMSSIIIFGSTGGVLSMMAIYTSK